MFENQKATATGRFQWADDIPNVSVFGFDLRSFTKRSEKLARHDVNHHRGFDYKKEVNFFKM